MCSEETLFMQVIIIPDIHAISRGNDRPNTAQSGRPLIIYNKSVGRR